MLKNILMKIVIFKYKYMNNENVIIELIENDLNILIETEQIEGNEKIEDIYLLLNYSNELLLNEIVLNTINKWFLNIKDYLNS